MQKMNKLWTPLSTGIRRVLPMTSRLSTFSPFSPNPQIYFQSSSRFQQLNGHDSLPNPKFSVQSFRLQSAANLDSKTKRCWNCGATETTPFLYCESCRSIQPVDSSIDYFQIFGLEKKYEVEVDGLERKYKDWQKKLHPDLVHSKSEKEREYAAEQSARVIDAYRTLSKPLSRAIYILRLEGVDIDEEQTVSDLELLTEIMEIREAVEEAPDTQALNQIQSQMEEKFEESSNSFVNAYRSRNFDEAVTCIQRMTYYQRASEEILKKL